MTNKRTDIQTIDDLRIALNDREKCEALFTRHPSIRSILIEFNLRPRVYYYEIVRKAAATHGLKVPEIPKRVPPSFTPVRRGAFADDDKVRQAVQGAKSFNEACKKLGVKSAGGNYSRMVIACDRIGIPVPPRYTTGRTAPRQPAVSKWTILTDEVLFYAKNGSTAKECLDALHLENTNHNLKQIQRIAKYGGHPFPHGLVKKPSDKIRYKTKLEDILVKGSIVENKTFKRRLVETGLLQNNCMICKSLPEWQGAPLVLQLDHINGDPTDNRLSNLRLLCPNCHSQTSTYVNKRNKRKVV